MTVESLILFHNHKIHAHWHGLGQDFPFSFISFNLATQAFTSSTPMAKIGVASEARLLVSEKESQLAILNGELIPAGGHQ